eukprot:50865_1
MTKDKVDKFFRKARAKLVDYENSILHYDSLFITIGGHGSFDSIICSDGQSYSYKDLRQLFENDTLLVSIPKIYLVDACRSDTDDIKMNSDNMSKPRAIKAQTNSVTCVGTSVGNTVRGAKIAECFAKRMEFIYDKHLKNSNSSRLDKLYDIFRNLKNDIEIQTKDYDDPQTLMFLEHDMRVDDVCFIPQQFGDAVRGSIYDHSFFEQTYNVEIKIDGHEQQYNDVYITLDHSNKQVILKYDNNQKE